MTVLADASPTDRTRSHRRWLGMFFIALGVAMIIVDATIVNVAVPQIIKDLGITSSDAQWVQEVYTLVFAALLLVWGWLADRYGRRLLFVTGAAGFAAASVLAAFAQSGPELIGSRVLQGIGGAMMLPASLSLLNAGFRDRDRAVAFAIWGSTIDGTAALGPLLGGWLTTSYSWRWAWASSACSSRCPCGLKRPRLQRLRHRCRAPAAGHGQFRRERLRRAARPPVGPVLTVRLGIALELAAVAGIGAVVGPATGWWATVPVLFVYGLGVGLATAQLTGVVLADIPVANSGQASGTQSTSRQIGSAFGIAILGTVLFTALGAQLSHRLASIPGLPAGQRAAIVTAVKQSAGAAISHLAADPRTAPAVAMAKEAFSQATRLTAFCAAIFLALGLLASLSLGRGGNRTQSQPADGGPGQQAGPAAQDAR